MPGRKARGAYYTPSHVVHSLLCWAIKHEGDRLLDPSCGDGRFIAEHPKSVGVEHDVATAAIAMQRAPGALVHEGDFFTWAASTRERFECAAGNPPFIRYQTFSGEARTRALTLCATLGANFSGLTSSWAPFLVAAASLLNPGGRMAFVVPAEIGHAPYSAPLLEYLVGHFQRVSLVAVREKLFSDLSEDCWLLYAEGFGASADKIDLTIVDRFQFFARPPRPTLTVSVSEWQGVWNKRLRPLLLPAATQELYKETAASLDTRRLADVASIGIGYVTGANDFFHLRPSEAAEWEIPSPFLRASVRNSRALPAARLTEATVREWRRKDDPVLLLHVPRDAVVPVGVRRYLESDGGKAARDAYKCRTRDPWYSVPDVQVPHLFLTYMSGRRVSIVRNDAKCTCTNSVHSVRVKNRSALRELAKLQQMPFFQLSCEIEGHPLGGGMLKLEPGEARRVLLPGVNSIAAMNNCVVTEGIAAMQSWRHYVAA